MKDIVGIVFGRVSERHLHHQQEEKNHQNLLSFVLKDRTVDLGYYSSGGQDRLSEFILGASWTIDQTT